MKLLIVGGLGYLGGAILSSLNQDYTVKIYDNALYEKDKKIPFDFIKGDVRNKKKLAEYLNWADAVVWLAAIVGDQACALNPLVTKEVNLESVKWLADNFKGRIIFTSTCSVYGINTGEANETTKVSPVSLYAKTKIKAEKYLINNNALILRLGTLYGLGGEYSRLRLDLVVNTFTAKAVMDKKIDIFSGEHYRPLIHVRDAAQIITGSIGTDSNGTYNIAKYNMTINEISEKIRKEFPDISINNIKFNNRDVRNYKVDIKKAEKDLGINPRISVEEGIKEVRNYLIKNRIDIKNPIYSNFNYLKDKYKII